MSSVLSNETDGFLFEWKVKNIHASFSNDIILSPQFETYNLHDSSWIMSLNPLNTHDGFRLNLRLMDANLESDENICVSLTVIAVTPNGNEVVLTDKEHFEFNLNAPIEVATFHSFTFSDETIVFNCYMKKQNGMTTLPFTHCLAHTLILSEKICHIWKVQNFENLLPDKQKKYRIFSTTPHSPDIEVVGTLSSKSKFHIEVHVMSSKRIFIIGKISVVTPKDDLKWSKMKGYLVENGSTSKVIFKFPLIIFRRFVRNHLHNGDLKLLCEFSFSTGELLLEIEETNYLTKDYYNLLRRRNGSITELKKIPIADTEDTNCSTEIASTPQTLKEDLKKFYLEKNHCDVTFQIEAEIFPAHKSILCSRSPVFNVMFDSDMKEATNKKVEIVDMDPDTLDRFLLFLYSETLEDLTWNRATKLLYAANKYQVESLKVECVSFLMSNVSVENVCEALKLSDLHQDIELKSACQNLIFEHEAEIFSSKEWELLTVENPILSAKTLQNHFAMKK